MDLVLKGSLIKISSEANTWKTMSIGELMVANILRTVLKHVFM